MELDLNFRPELEILWTRIKNSEGFQKLRIPLKKYAVLGNFQILQPAK